MWARANMSVLAAKLLLAPVFVMGASLAARRFGARIGGLLGGLPMVAGPILLVFALTHGRAFAAQAATATLLGIVSLCAFILVYAHLARRLRWTLSLLGGWLAFLLASAALSQLPAGAPEALMLALASLAVTVAALPRPLAPSPSPADPPSWDLPLRGASAASRAFARPLPCTAPERGLDPPSWDLPLRGLSALALVIAITALSGPLGPKLSGLLTPFPVVATVLAAFTHAQHGEHQLVRIMRGFATGLVAYVLFCFALALALRSAAVAPSFLLALLAALATQVLVLSLALRRS